MESKRVVLLAESHQWMTSTWLIIHMVKNKITKILIKIQSWHSRLDESAILDLCYLGIRSSCSITHHHLSVKYSRPCCDSIAEISRANSCELWLDAGIPGALSTLPGERGRRLDKGVSAATQTGSHYKLVKCSQSVELGKHFLRRKKPQKAFLPQWWSHPLQTPPNLINTVSVSKCWKKLCLIKSFFDGD